MIGNGSQNCLLLETLLKDEEYQRFLASEKYYPVPFLHLAYKFEVTPIKLGCPYIDGNILQKTLLDDNIELNTCRFNLEEIE